MIKHGLVSLLVLFIASTAFASQRLNPGGHHHTAVPPGGNPIPFDVAANGISFTWGNPPRDYVFQPTNPRNPDQGFYYSKNAATGATVGTIHFHPGNPDSSGTYTATGVAGQGGTYTRP